MDQKPRNSEGSVEQSTEPRFLVIGRIVRPHGVRGEVRVELHTSDPARFQQLEFVHIGDPSAKPTTVNSARLHQDVVLLTFDGVTTRNEADLLRNQWLYVPTEEAIPLEDGEYFLYQLEGLTVRDQNGRELGQLAEVMETGANNVFVVHGDFGDILLPDIPDVVQDIDFDTGVMVVQLLPGLVDSSLLGGAEPDMGEATS
ncbi:MAG: ribosome maturation factor RimM [Chloroflexota bacterium]